MSPSKTLARRKSVLRVTAPPGVMIQVFDDNFRELAAGTERVTVSLAAGLYTVRWQAYDLNVEEIVRSSPASTPTFRGR